MKDFFKALGYFVAALLFVLSAVFLSSVINPEKPEDKKTDRTFIACPENFNSYSELIKNPKNVAILIDEKTPMYAEGGQFKSKFIVTKIETEKSKVACGYLSVSAGTNTNGALQSWENLYINPNNFGGHINPINNIGPGDGETSQYIFPLSKMNYWKTRADRAQNNLLFADWGVLLNVSEKITFEVGLNTNDKTGFIDNFLIAYKCWNPETGEENYDCKIVVE
jgi:hypothetical protein